MKDKYIFVGPDPHSNKSQTLGGQVTAAAGLARYAKKNNFSLTFIDNSQQSFPPPSFITKITSGGGRLFKLFFRLRSAKIKGVIIFANNGFSFYERITMSLLCRVFNVPSLFFIRDGNFKNALSSPGFSVFFVKKLLKIPSYIGSQGIGWNKLYDALGVHSKKIILVRNWLPFGYSVTKIKKEVNECEVITFVYVGWLIKEKGIYEILDAIDSLSSLYTFKFIFVGGGDLEEMLNERIRNTSLCHRVISMGWQEKNEVKKILSASHVFVLPSYAEGFPNSLLEAMSLGLPAICSDVGGISDSLHDDINGYLISPKNTKSLELAMEKYLVNIELIGIHSQAALSIVAKNHDWESNCRKLFETFDENTIV